MILCSLFEEKMYFLMSARTKGLGKFAALTYAHAPAIQSTYFTLNGWGMSIG